MEYFVISAKFVPLKYYTLSSQLRRLTSFSVGLFGSANSVTRSYPVMRKSCIRLPRPRFCLLHKIFDVTILAKSFVFRSLKHYEILSWPPMPRDV